MLMFAPVYLECFIDCNSGFAMLFLFTTFRNFTIFDCPTATECTLLSLARFGNNLFLMMYKIICVAYSYLVIEKIQCYPEENCRRSKNVSDLEQFCLLQSARMLTEARVLATAVFKGQFCH